MSKIKSRIKVGDTVRFTAKQLKVDWAKAVVTRNDGKNEFVILKVGVRAAGGSTHLFINNDVQMSMTLVESMFEIIPASDKWKRIAFDMGCFINDGTIRIPGRKSLKQETRWGIAEELDEEGWLTDVSENRLCHVEQIDALCAALQLWRERYGDA